jgi:hypothetical protein
MSLIPKIGDAVNIRLKKICKYCDYIIEYDAERIRHVLIDHQTKCLYCENSLDYANKTEHILDAHPQRCIHCTEYSIEYQTHMDQVNHMNAFHKQILEQRRER